MASLRDVASLMRLGNSLAIGFASIVGYTVSGGSDWWTALLLFLSSSLIGAAGNVVNDIMDLEIDRINKPWRPLPSGRMSVRSAWILYAILNIVGLSTALALGIPNGVVAATAILLLFLYSWRLKKVLLVGNNVVASLSGIVLVYGGLPAPNPMNSLVPAIFAYLLILGREFLKSLEDVEGDKKFGVATLATAFGPRVAYVASIIVIAILIALSPLPFIFMGYRLPYILLAVLGTDLSLAVALVIARRMDSRSAWRATRLMKISFVCGLLAFLLGAPSNHILSFLA